MECLFCWPTHVFIRESCWQVRLSGPTEEQMEFVLEMLISIRYDKNGCLPSLLLLSLSWACCIACMSGLSCSVDIKESKL